MENFICVNVASREQTNSPRSLFL
uniref:Uncharacterized protein n=1 Tax=Rhizophora mucronata TaxID=61149 RepID=A0A2P2R182_RHIMU